MKPRVVLDTNIIISAILFDGKPWEIIKLALQEKSTLFTSQELLAEIERVLLDKFKFDPNYVGVILKLYTDLASIVHPKKKVRKITADPADNRVLEAALEAKATFIITGDKHLLELNKYRGIKILKPADLLKE